MSDSLHNRWNSARTPAAVLAAFLFFAAVFHRFFGHSLIFFDSFRLYAPIKSLVAHSWRAGAVMGWDPHQLLGIPFVGYILAGYFYPLNILYVVLPFEPAHRIFILVHYPLAALFMRAFLRGRKFSEAASAIGSVGFALSGYMVSQHANVAFLIGPAWAPLCFYFADRAMDGRLRMAGAAGAVLAMQVLAGEPQSAAITAALVAALGLGRAFSPGHRARALAAMALAGTWSMALAAVQLLPTMKFMSLTVRNAGVDFAHAARFSLHPLRLIGLVWPTPLGPPWPDPAFWGQFTFDSSFLPHPMSVTNYLGLPLLALAVLGLVRGRRRMKLWIGALALLFLLMALGRYTPVFAAAYKLLLPVRLFRFPVKYLAWFSGLAAVAAALGFESIEELMGRRPRVLARAGFYYAAAAVCAGLLFITVWAAAMDRWSGFAPGSPQYAAALAHLYHTALQWGAVNAAAGLGLALAARRGARRAMGAFAFLVIAVDLAMANVSTMPAGPASIFDFEPAVKKVISPGGEPALGRFRICRDKMEFRDRDPSLAADTPLARRMIWERNTLAPNLDTMEGFEDVVGFNEARPTEGLETLKQSLSPDLMELYNVRYIIAPSGRAPLKSVRSRVIADDPVKDFQVIELTDYLPRAYWVPGAVRAKDEAEAADKLTSVDLARNVVLTTGDSVGPAPAGAPARKPADITVYLQDRVELKVDAPAAGWLVLSDRYYPGWRAWVDGRPAEIYPADVMVRAVRVPPGAHRVTFRFRPPWLRDGEWISLAAWAALAIWLASALVVKRKGG